MSEIICPDCGSIIGDEPMSADPMRRRFFAIVRDVHANLPEPLRQRFPSSEALRKHALIAAGHCDQVTLIAASEEGAVSLATFLRRKDRFAIMDIKGAILTIWTARSMSRRALLKPQFKEVSQKALDWIQETTGIDPNGSQEAA